MPKKSKGALLSEEDGPSEGAHQTDSKKKGRRKGRRRSDVSDSEDEAHDGNARQDSAKVVDNKRQEQLKCFFCGKRGHTRAECPEAQGRSVGPALGTLKYRWGPMQSFCLHGKL